MASSSCSAAIPPSWRPVRAGMFGSPCSCSPPLVVGLIGAVAERLIVGRFYGQIVTTMLATWGLSLFLIGLVTAIFGNTTRGVAAPLGSVAIGAYSVSAYQFV